MTTAHPWLAAVSDAALQAQAGPSVFGRGQTYARSGAIRDPAIPPLEPGEQIALEAVVQGTQPYHTRVWIDTDNTLDGDCDCPHAEDGYFCKHQVALALTLRGILGGAAPEPDAQAHKKVAAAQKRAQTQANNREALRTFVREQSAEVLAERLWQWADRDRHLMAELKAWAAQARAGTDAKALAQAINELLRNHSGFLDWRDSNAYANRASKVLPLLQPWLRQDPAQLRELCEHTLRRLYKVAEHSDDSDGAIGDVMQQVQDLLLEALQAAPPPASWLDRWFALMEADPWGLWHEADVLAAAGPAVQARYAERAAQDWRRWVEAHPTPAPPAKPRSALLAAVQDDRYDAERNTLRTRYLNSLKQSGDVQAVIDAMRSHLKSGHEHTELVAYCEAHGRYREAMQYAQAASQRYPGDWRVEDALLRCYERDGWDEEALTIRRRRLENTPSLDNYQAALKAAQRAGRDRHAYRDELHAWACQQETASHPALPFSSGMAHWMRPTPTGTRVVSVRLTWLLSEGRLEEALALITAPGHVCGSELIKTLARALPAERNAEAVPLLQRAFNADMEGAKSPYTAVLALVRETMGRMGREQQISWLDALHIQHKAKRNFIAGLPR